MNGMRLVVAGLLLLGFATAAIGQEDGPGYGPGPYGMGPGDEPGGGPEGMDPYGGPRGMGRRGDMGGEDGGPGGGGGGDLQEASVKVHGTERPYYFHVPANLARPVPLVMMFHGGNGNPHGIARKTGWNELADQNGFIVVYPQGSPTRSGRGGTWNVGANFSAAAARADDTAYVAAILADVRRHAQIDPDRIFAAGHSMGGVFAYRLACDMSGTFAAIGVVSSTMVEKGCRPADPVAILHIHGTADDRIPLAGGHGAETTQERSWPAPQAGVATWARLDACAPQPSRSTQGDMSCETYDHCRATVEMCVREGGEHPWAEGETSRIWAFFAAHPKVAR